MLRYSCISKTIFSIEIVMIQDLNNFSGIAAAADFIVQSFLLEYPQILFSEAFLESYSHT